VIEVLKVVFEVAVLSVIFYYILVFVRSTGAVQALRGIFFLGVVILLSRILRLDVLYALFSRSVPYLALAFVVIFHEELRRALAELGKGKFFSHGPDETAVIEEVIKAVSKLSSERIGALIALERDISLENFVLTGIRLDAPLSGDLLASIFTPPGPLHDGAVIIEGNRIRAARCALPLAKKSLEGRGGMRHRAALGLAEVSDALVLVVSEETGRISVAFRAKLFREVDEERLRKFMENRLRTPRRSGRAPKREKK